MTTGRINQVLSWEPRTPKSSQAQLTKRVFRERVSCKSRYQLKQAKGC